MKNLIKSYQLLVESIECDDSIAFFSITFNPSAHSIPHITLLGWYEGNSMLLLRIQELYKAKFVADANGYLNTSIKINDVKIQIVFAS